MKRSALYTGLTAVLLCYSHPLDAADSKSRPVAGTIDNSFLVEEAYNQEAGVVQHIFNASFGVDKLRGPDDRAWALSFTQEWPLGSQRHQFSYTVPFTSARTAGQGDDGIGDVLLHYRFQAYFNEESLTAFAPRASLVLPTGKAGDGFSDDTVGFQGNLPFSTTLGDRWFLHLNAGLTWLPQSSVLQPRRDLTHYNFGASVICAVREDLHLMLECVANWNQVANTAGGKRRELNTVISPGVRKAFNFANDSQLVVGVATPIGLTASAPDYGVFLYVSFEHFFKRRK